MSGVNSFCERQQAARADDQSVSEQGEASTTIHASTGEWLTISSFCQLTLAPPSSNASIVSMPLLSAASWTACQSSCPPSPPSGNPTAAPSATVGASVVSSASSRSLGGEVPSSGGRRKTISSSTTTLPIALIEYGGLSTSLAARVPPAQCAAATR